MEEEEENQDSCCRLCLKFGKNMENLFSDDSKYILLIEDFTGLKLEYVTGLPSVICEACLEKINILIDFKETCRKSQEILENQRNLKVELLKVINEISNDDNNDPLLNVKDEVEDENSCEFEKEMVVEFKLGKNHTVKSLSNPKDSETNTHDCDNKLKKSKRTKSKSKSIQRNRKKVHEKSEKITKKESESEKRTTESEPGMKLWRKYAKAYDIPCHICGKLYSKFRMEYHLNRHLDRKPFGCKVEGCDKTYSSPIHLRQHKIHCHSDYAPHKCEICERGFKTRNALKMHKTYHFEPQIPCKVCGKLIRNHKSMKKHMFNHTGERPYKCNECSKSFKTHWSLKVHLRIHTNEKPFICTVCGLSFTYSQVLKSHVEKNHPGAVVSYAQKSTIASTEN